MPRKIVNYTHTELLRMKAEPKARVITVAPSVQFVIAAEKPDGSGGAKSFVYRSRLGRGNLFKMGTFPTYSLAEARAEGAEALKLEKQGTCYFSQRKQKIKDEAEAKKAAEEDARQANERTFQALAEDYISRKLGGWDGKTLRAWRGVLGQYVYPQIGNRPVAEIGVADMLAVLGQKVKGKALFNAHRATARQAFQKINVILQEARRKKWRTESLITWADIEDDLPHEDTTPPDNRASLEWSRIPELYEELSKRRAVGALCYRLIVLTALRSNEARQLQWRWVKMESAQDGCAYPALIVPREYMKNGRKDIANGYSKPHRVPLSKAALSVLAEAWNRQTEDGATPATIANIVALAGTAEPEKAIFIGYKGGPLHDPAVSAVVHRINVERQAADLHLFVNHKGDTVTPHGARSSFRQWAGDKGVAEVVAEHALAHSWGTEAQKAYINDHFLARVDVMNRWAEWVVGQEAA